MSWKKKIKNNILLSVNIESAYGVVSVINVAQEQKPLLREKYFRMNVPPDPCCINPLRGKNTRRIGWILQKQHSCLCYSVARDGFVHSLLHYHVQVHDFN